MKTKTLKEMTAGNAVEREDCTKDAAHAVASAAPTVANSTGASVAPSPLEQWANDAMTELDRQRDGGHTEPPKELIDQVLVSEDSAENFCAARPLINRWGTDEQLAQCDDAPFLAKIGILHGRAGHSGTAEAWLEKALAMAEQRSGRDAPLTVDIAEQLSSAWRPPDALGRSIELSQRVLAYRRRREGPDTFAAFWPLMNQAGWLFEQRDEKASVARLKEAMELWLRNGPVDPQTCAKILDRLETFADEGTMVLQEAATELLDQAIARIDQAPAGADATQQVGKLALLSQYMQADERALVYALAALALLDGRIGCDMSHLPSVLSAVASRLCSLDRHDEAIPYLERLDALVKDAAPAEGAYPICGTLLRLSACYRELGRTADAERCLAMYEAIGNSVRGNHDTVRAAPQREATGVSAAAVHGAGAKAASPAA